MDAADVDVDRTVEWLVADQVQEPTERESIAGAGDERCGPGTEHDDVVERTADEGFVDDGDRGFRRAGSERVDEVVAQPRDDDLARIRQRCVEPVGPVVILTPDHPGATTGQGREPPSLRVGGFDARPRLGERGLSAPEALVDLDHVRAVVGGEDLRTEHVIADESARDRVPVRGASAAGVDVRLYRESLARMEPPGQLASDGDDRHGGFVTEARGLWNPPDGPN